MPVYTNGKLSTCRSAREMVFAGDTSFKHDGPERPKCIHIGLINNMPDAALEPTERQFLTLLDAAAQHLYVRVSFYALPDVPRKEPAQQRINRFYSKLENLWNSQIDGLIVTGREPRTSNLADEPYWGNLTKVLEWAEDNTHSTVWSCLAAHAAILHMDGIARRRSDEKRCGIFDCTRVSDHPMTAGLSSPVKMPHSRWNDIPEDELKACGYSVLTQAQGAGADTFVKQRKSLFVFFQGHPEYEAETLLLEYRRDVRRYLTGEANTYPSLPLNYFDNDTAATLNALRDKAISGRDENMLEELAAAMDEKKIVRSWQPAATRLYSNWLAYVSAQKQRSLNTRPSFRELRAGEMSWLRP
jgi:homoserine O-succinyltransferase/O-acetyltransferase